jgi:hypothetical protein
MPSHAYVQQNREVLRKVTSNTTAWIEIWDATAKGVIAGNIPSCIKLQGQCPPLGLEVD